MHMAFVGHIHVFQHLFGPFDDVLLTVHRSDGVQFKRAVPFGKTGDHHVFHHREIAKDLGRLEHAADPHLVDLMRRTPQHRLPVKHDGACVRDQLADKAVQQRGFARPVGADDRVHGVFGHAEVHV